MRIFTQKRFQFYRTLVVVIIIHFLDAARFSNGFFFVELFIAILNCLGFLFLRCVRIQIV